MPYLPFDLDAKRKAALVAKALGVDPGVIAWGLLELWDHVWRSRGETTPDVVSELFLAGCFGPDARLTPALVEAGFLEPVDGKFRVRGAGKWLFGMEGRSRGGHKAKSNLIPGARQKRNQPSPAEKPEAPFSAPAESQPRASRDPLSAPHSALTSSIQHPASEKIFSALTRRPRPNRRRSRSRRSRRTLATRRC